MSFDLDMSQVADLAYELRDLPKQVQREIPPVIEWGAVSIKEQLRAEMRASAHFGQAADAITYDLHDGGFTAEIGPTKGGAGSLANIAYFGGGAWSGRKRPGPGWQSGPGGGGTVPDPRGALEAEAPNVEREILNIVSRVLGR